MHSEFSRHLKPTDNIETESPQTASDVSASLSIAQTSNRSTTAIEHYRSEYNNDRIHINLGSVPPAYFVGAVTTTVGGSCSEQTECSWTDFDHFAISVQLLGPVNCHPP